MNLIRFIFPIILAINIAYGNSEKFNYDIDLCSIKYANEIDDCVSDATTIAKVVASLCRNQIEKYVNEKINQDFNNLNDETMRRMLVNKAIPAISGSDRFVSAVVLSRAKNKNHCKSQ